MERFDHYELVEGVDGKPVELGRGGMGVTYKAFDVQLRCPVALKIITEALIGDQSARLRFVREARAAASVRHPNIASVFHLGSSGDQYFYAMEFIEGETLESLIKRSRRLDVPLALEIASQVAAGLTAVHKQRLVHRDIKPTNIMVSFGDAGAVTAKLIDLGLAKMTDEPGSGSAISVAGSFVGTPRYASPEQFAGMGADIRSDLYSLGVVLWEMVTGQEPFSGSPAEMMSQHQHASLPLERIEGLPAPVVTLMQKLLEKDPRRRFQSPAELLSAINTGVDDSTEVLTLGSEKPGQFRTPNALGLMPTRRATAGPEKISIARLPVTGANIFGREEDIAFLDDCWGNPHIHVVTIAAWGGVGKSTLINHWLRAMAAQEYRSAERVFGWSFYRQGMGGDTSSGDEFLHAALAWFGDHDPRIGTPWEKGERLANLVARRRTLLILDGLEPLQYPPGPQEGRIRDPALQALLRQLSAFNRGLCVITTRLPVADIADQERTSAPRRNLEHLSSEEGAKLLRALGVHGDAAELRNASDEFSGHCLALTLLGSYLADAHNGEIRSRREVLGHLADDARQGAHARRVMQSYQSWLGEGPELATLRILGLFDRPADDEALEALLRPPGIPGVTDSLTELSASERRKVVAKLRRARLVAGNDPHHPGHLDVHPIVREYFGEQLRTQQPDAWKEGNKRLYQHYRTLAPQLPDTFGGMEPLFLAVICACRAGLFREALHEIYIPRIQRGAAFAASVLGARSALLATLVHFFQRGSWQAPLHTGSGEQILSQEDQLYILMQVTLHLSMTQGIQLAEVRICHERAVPLCESLGRTDLLFVALVGQWRCSLVTSRLTTTLRLAEQIDSLARQRKQPAPLMKAHMAMAATLYYLGDFEKSREHAMDGVQMLHFGCVEPQTEELDEPAIACFCHEALCAWHLGEIPSSYSSIAEAISLARELGDVHGLAVALYFGAILRQMDRDPPQVERMVAELIELSNRHGFAHFSHLGTALHGWARGMSGDIAQAISCIDEAVANLEASGGMLCIPYFLGLKAEPLHLAGEQRAALKTIEHAQVLVERSGERWWSADLYRLRGLCLAALGDDDAKVESAFLEALRISRAQKSISLQVRAEQAISGYRARKRGDGS